jgi:hypothetical protein
MIPLAQSQSNAPNRADFRVKLSSSINSARVRLVNAVFSVFIRSHHKSSTFSLGTPENAAIGR